MGRPRATSTSLTYRLLWVMISALSAVALLLGATGALFINGITEKVADRVLKASALAIAETLAVENGEITLDLPPEALGMLEDNARDYVYYNIRHEGQVLTGYPDFPAVDPAKLNVNETYFRYATYRGNPIRVAAEARRLPRIDGLVVVQVAETLDERGDLTRQLLAALAVLEAALVAVAGLLVWPAMRWGLRPLTQLRRAMDARPKEIIDFTPLQVEAAPAEMRGLVTAFNSLLSRLDGSVEGMRRFTADASHQMRTPLAVLATHLALLRRHGTQTPEGRASLDDVQAASERLQRLLTQLVALARAEEAPAAQAASPPVDLADIAGQVARDVAPSAFRRRISIDFEAPETPAWVRGDAILIGEVAFNLLDNAIRYNRRGGHVAVKVVLGDGDTLVLVVEDDGPGVPADQREKVFQRFHRLARDQATHGSGLGLSIVRALAATMGASVTLDDGAGGRGLSVRVVFPRVKEPDAGTRPAPCRKKA